ncbi:Transmembrane protein 14C [Lonchura striata]|uniref:Transmembrane protein 14C n=1 Tax=Lonchura striata TaxID=40157 RepID=A0A218VDQ7_9PASE|nr:Transmembrane protein 14C [Lonchura striata domestica]
MGLLDSVGTMAVDWIGFAYASLLVVGGVVAYTRKGSKISLAAGLAFGSVAGYGAYCVTFDPRNVKISLCKCFTTVSKQTNKQHPELHVKLSFYFIFSFDHYNGNEVQEVQEINASRTSSVPEPFDDFEACVYAAVGDLELNMTAMPTKQTLSVLERQV